MSSKRIVTGVAGFIGSTLARRLLAEGCEVVGVDCLTDYYAENIKRDNLASLLDDKRFTFIQKNITEINWAPVLEGATAVFHLAAQAGVRASWGSSFKDYTDLNIHATQVLLEAMKGSGARMVYSSSSSVYGDTVQLPMREDHLPRPHSPYGVTKLAAEHLCGLYWRNYKTPAVSLRYFTVYGPRQRPDMAFNRFIRKALLDQPITLYGDGDQTRDFTFVDDVVEANIQAASRPGVEGGVYNIGGGTRASVNEVLQILGGLMGRPIKVHTEETQKGDVRHTYADTAAARRDLGFDPKVGLQEGLRREIEWIQPRIGMFEAPAPSQTAVR